MPSGGNATEQIEGALGAARARVVRRDEALEQLVGASADELLGDVKVRAGTFVENVELSTRVRKVYSFHREVTRLARRIRRTENARRLRSRLRQLRRTERRLSSAEYQLHVMAPEIVCRTPPESVPEPEPDPGEELPPCTGTPFGTDDVATGAFMVHIYGSVVTNFVFDCFETEWLEPRTGESSRLELRLMDRNVPLMMKIVLADLRVRQYPEAEHPRTFDVVRARLDGRDLYVGGLHGYVDVTAFDAETGRLALTYNMPRGEHYADWGEVDLADFRIGLVE